MESEGLQSLNRQADALANEGTWDDAALALNSKILHLDPGSVLAHLRAAKCRMVRGEPIEAAELYEAALGIDPDNRIATNRLEDMRLAAHRASVVENMKAYVQSMKTYTEAFSAGMAAGSEDNGELAVALLERARELEDTDHVRVALAAAYRRVRRLDEAETLYREEIRHSQSPAAKVGLAGVLRDRRRLQEAHALEKAVLAKHPNSRYALRGLAGILADLGDKHGAIEAYEDSLSEAEKAEDEEYRRHGR